MIYVYCRCGVRLEAPDEQAGKRAKCPQCGAALTVPGVKPAPTGTQAAPAQPARANPKPSKSRKCSQCGAVIPVLTFSCDYCGAPLPRDDQNAPPVANSTTVEYRPRGMVDGIQGALGKFTKSLDPYRHLREECQQVPDSPEALVSFFSKHIGGLDDFHDQVSALHSQACQGALTKLRVFAGNDARLAATVASLEQQLVATQRRKRLKSYAVFGGVAGAVLLLLLIASIGMFITGRGEDAALNDIQTMVREGRFDEARVRAGSLDGSDAINRALEAIDKAEKNRHGGKGTGLDDPR